MTPHYLVGCSYPDDSDQPWHVRDTDDGRIVARFASAAHARDWCALLNSELPPDVDLQELQSVGFAARHEPEADAEVVA